MRTIRQSAMAVQARLGNRGYIKRHGGTSAIGKSRLHKAPCSCTNPRMADPSCLGTSLWLIKDSRHPWIRGQKSGKYTCVKKSARALRMTKNGSSGPLIDKIFYCIVKYHAIRNGLNCERAIIMNTQYATGNNL